MAQPTIRVVVDDRKLQELIKATGGKRILRIVRDGVDYGLYQEMGTSRMAAHPFMVPAVEEVRPGFLKAIGSLEGLMQAENVVDHAAEAVEYLAKEKAPFDTGALRASIIVEKVT